MLDLDIMIACDADSVRSLVGRLKNDFYVDEHDAVQAVANQSTFNAIHLGSSLNVDFFLAERQPFAARQLDRRHAMHVEREGVRLYFYAPEDLIVRKLSEGEWRDVLGVLKTSADLDVDLLRESANEAGVNDLLDRALADAR